MPVLRLLEMTVILFAHRFARLAMLAVVCPGTVAAQELSSPSQASATIEPFVASSADPAYGSRRSAPDDPHSVTDTAVLIRPVPNIKRPDFNRNIYYKNKLEFSLETGWLPNNIPFIFDFIVGSKYNSWPLHYTLVPNIASVRWQLDNIWGWKLFRGNTDFSFSGSYTAIPRGAETRYFAFDYGIRRNFIPPRWRVVPYVEGRGGIGNINAKGPYGVRYAQGQDMTFTLMIGSGARYNFGPRYAISGGATYMHVSNFYLSEPRYEDIGINVYGAIVGVYMRIGKPKPDVVP
jgi:hypothetical protein